MQGQGMALIWVITLLVLLPRKLHSQSFDSTIFEFNNFVGNEGDLIYQGDAHIATYSPTGSIVPAGQRYIRLTSTRSGASQWQIPQQNSVGRVLYSPLIRLWNDAEHRRASFQSVIRGHIGNPWSRTIGADGISFFISTVANSSIPSGSAGGNMGIYQPSGFSAVNLIAVELDAFANTWDPRFPHVAIQANSRTSVLFDRWNAEGGATDFEARITFEPSRRLLSVVATGSPNATGRVEATFDIKNVLSEWVQIGISASTSTGEGVAPALHDIHFWSFISYMVSNDLTLQPQDS